ncbi:ABC transporter permease [Planotetraspora sp. A-T 1434]|uniref:ABC transporter permease n=1 Tax=Planotetraspora sp. A-T 1434 TaxID=2979219 RepID=UPI0021BE93FD|nr:ABC transporter permease [Planotetraspora sp. A-T 1434]MCT9929172.1 ABC transporter permease [Planotetraspora sp. A-T 1434]
MLKDTGLFLAYELRNTARNPIWPLFGLLQPVLYLLLFAPLLANTSPGVPQAETLKQFTPGVMLMIALFGSLFVGFGMIAEIRGGVLERLAASPASRPAIVLGRTLRDMIVLVIQAVLIVVVALLMGMRPSLPGVALMLVLMALTGVFASGLSYGLALALRDENGMSQILQFFALPLILLTGILLPMSLAPQWMQVVAKANPLYHAVEAGRALFVGDLASGEIALAFGLMLVLALITLRWSVRSMRHLAD